MNFDEFLKKHGEFKSFQQGDHVFRQGEPNTEVYFVQSGVLKGYYLSQEGKESIKSFLFSGDTIASLRAVYKDEPTSFSLICLEDTALISIPFQELYSMSQSDISISHFFVEGLIALSLKKEQREYEFLCLSAEDRYKKLLTERPQISKSITQNDIARYLGITPVALSRIRKRIAENT